MRKFNNEPLSSSRSGNALIRKGDCISKEEFFNSIAANTVADEDFFKKIYCYSYSDKSFIGQVARKLVSLGRKEVIEKYNQWIARYQEQENAILKEVSSWYVKQVDDWYEREVRKASARRKQRKYQFIGLPQDW